MKFVNISTGSVIDHSIPTDPPHVVRNGDWLILTHLGTERSLRSHGRRAPYSKSSYQACGYGDVNNLILFINKNLVIVISILHWLIYFI